MKVALISYDANIAEKTSESYKRMLEYASHLDHLFVLILASNKRASFTSGNVTVWVMGGHPLLRLTMGYRVLKKWVIENKINIISSQEPFEGGLLALLASRFGEKAKPKVEVQLHGDFFGNDFWRTQKVINRIRLIIGKFVLKRCDRTRVVSDRIEKKLISIGIDQNCIHKIPVYTRLVNADNHESKGIRNRFSNSFLVVCVARLTKEKHVDLLSRATPYICGSIPNAQVVVVGSGPQFGEVIATAKSFGIGESIYFEGQVSNPAPWYSAADVVVIPSHTEGWGRVAVEAMAAGAAIVMTDVGLAGEVLFHERNGLIIPVDRDDLLAESVVRLYKDPELRERLGKEARLTYESLPGKNELVSSMVDAWKSTCLSKVDTI